MNHKGTRGFPLAFFRISEPILFLPLLIAACLAVFSLLRAWPDTIDDAHITYRCLENWLGGYGLTFNPGSLPVEGFSNPLFLFVLAPFVFLGMSPDAAAFGLGLVSFVFCVFAAAGLVVAMGGTQRGAVLAAAGVLGHFPLLYYAVTGLETGFYAALISAALWRYVALKNRLDGYGAVLWLLVALTRPEGILYPALLGCSELTAAIRSRGRGDKNGASSILIQSRTSMLWLFGIASAFCAFLVWRYSYFGSWLPNTFLAKPPGSADLSPGGSPLIKSSAYLFGFVVQMGILLPLAAMAQFCHRPHGRYKAAGLGLLGGLIFAFYAGGDWMPMSRFLVPTLVPWLSLGACSVENLRLRFRSPSIAPNIYRIFFGAVALSSFIAPMLLLRESYVKRDQYPFHVMNSSTCRSAALALRNSFGSNHKIVAYRIGALGRFSGMTVVDPLGLVDREIGSIISRHPSYHPAERLGDDLPEMKAIIKRLNPDFVLAVQPPTFLSENPTLYDAKYRFHRLFVLGADQVWQLYIREP